MSETADETQREAAGAKREKLWTADFAILVGVSLGAFLACQGLNNGSPLYVEKLGGAVALAGGLITFFSASAAITRIFVGRLLDRHSCQFYIVLGAVLMFLGTAGAIVFPGLEAQFVLRSLQGMGFGCITTASAKGAAEVLPASRMGEGIGYFGLGQSLGLAIGPPTAVALSNLPYASALFVGFSFLTAVLMLLAGLSRYEKHADRLPESSAYRQRAERMAANGGVDPQAQEVKKLPILQSLFVKTALHGAIPTLFACAGNALVINFTALYGTRLGVANPGLFFFCAAATMTAIRLAGGAFFDKVPPRILMIFPIVSGVISLAFLLLWPTQIGFLLGGAFFGFNMGIALPLLNTMCVKCTVPERWGSASSMFMLAQDIGVGVSAVAWGALIDAFGHSAAYLVGIGLCIFTYMISLVCFPRNVDAHGNPVEK